MFKNNNQSPSLRVFAIQGFMWDLMPEFSAMIVFAEHRFYGKTLPFGNDSYKVFAVIFE